MNPRSKLLAVLSWTGVGLAVAAFVAGGFATEIDRRRRAVRAEDGCLAFAAPPAIELVLNDRTDPLTGDQPRRWRAAFDAELGRLPAGSVLLIGAIGPAVAAEEPLDKLCVPLAGRGAQPQRLQAAFDRRVEAIGQQLLSNPSTPKSAISGTILAAAADSDFLAPTTGPRRIEVASDLLENDVASAYQSGFTLPAPRGRPLTGVTIRFTVLRNLRDQRYQSEHLI
jgi:hypothetical protein